MGDAVGTDGLGQRERDGVAEQQCGERDGGEVEEGAARSMVVEGISGVLVNRSGCCGSCW